MNKNSDFSEYQRHRQSFTPITPSILEECVDEPVILKDADYPIADGLAALFPTLIGKGMKYYELSFNDNGDPAKSDKPMNVCIFIFF